MPLRIKKAYFLNSLLKEHLQIDIFVADSFFARNVYLVYCMLKR